jgi:hypothetical protein
MKLRMAKIEPIERLPVQVPKRTLLLGYINARDIVAAPDCAARSNHNSNHITITRAPTLTRL